MKPKRNPYSEEEYFSRLDNMLLSSCETMRSLFKTRWKLVKRETWIEDEDHGKKLLDKTFKSLLQRASGKVGMEKVESGQVQEWDMTLLNLVIQNLGDQKLFKCENNAVRSLKKMRNDCAHHSTKKISVHEYNSKLELFKEYMMELHATLETIEKIIARASVTTSVIAMERVKELNIQAEEFMKNDNIQEALYCYNEAIGMPSLLDEHLGAQYENLAACYLRNKILTKEIIDEAMQCGQKAIELNESSWNAYNVIGQCFRKRADFDNAISCFQRALAISPIQMQVKNDLDGCKALKGVQERDEHLDFKCMPMNFDERMAHLENETGIKMSKEEFVTLNMSEELASLIKGQDHVFQGHRYLMGWNVEKNDTEACRYYSAAAKVGNAEGLYNLGLCYKSGRGVTQDVEMAYDYILSAARKLPDFPETNTKNPAVQSAQHVIGLMYESGVGVEQNHQEAVKWYKMAMENGSDMSANNLGLLYFHGVGVPKDRKYAAFCWKFAVSLKNVNAQVSLANYYIVEMEPEFAWTIFKNSKEFGYGKFATVSDEEFSNLTSMAERKRKIREPQVLEFEAKHQMDVKGMTFKERFDCMQNFTDSATESNTGFFIKDLMMGVPPVIMEGGVKIPLNREELHFDTSVFSDSEILQNIKRKSENGSETAKGIFQLLGHSKKITALIKTDRALFYNELYHQLIDFLYKCATIPFDTLNITEKDTVQLKRMLRHLFNKHDGEKCDYDMQLRLCYAVYNAKHRIPADGFAEKILQEGIRRYPDNKFYFYHLSLIFASNEDNELALECINNGLKITPKDPSLLFERAYNLRQLKKDTCHALSNNNVIEDVAVIQAFKDFLQCSECDHRLRPAAYFSMGVVIFDFSMENDSKIFFMMLGAIHNIYECGVLAEKKQIACFKSENINIDKEMLEQFINSYKSSFGADKNVVRDLKTMEQQQPKSILVTKPYLMDPARKMILTEHRKNLKSMNRWAKSKTHISSTRLPKLEQTVPERAFTLKPIILHEMNPMSDAIYLSRVLDLTLIDDPSFGRTSIHLVAEDLTGDVTRLYIYNVAQDEQALERFGFGRRIAIMNPYMRLGSMSITPGIRNDDPDCILYLGKVDDMCRFCGERDSQLCCRDCKRGYCSKECQKLDWTEFQHKLICKVNPGAGMDFAYLMRSAPKRSKLKIKSS